MKLTINVKTESDTNNTHNGATHLRKKYEN
jgi:hypothetical protein